jgi:putative lipoic acid-binding regulatory protein
MVIIKRYYILILIIIYFNIITIGNKDKVDIFNELMKFPCEFTIKIIAINDETIIEDLLCLISGSINTSSDKIKVNITSKSKTGKYISISFTPIFNNSKEIYNIYDLVSKESRVKYTL